MSHLFSSMFLSISLLFPSLCLARSITIGIIEDSNRSSQSQVYKKEIGELFKDKQEIRFKSLILPNVTDAKAASGLLEKAYKDKTIDVVLVTNVVASHILIKQKRFKKPTFLGRIFNSRMIGAPEAGDRSGKNNLNYLSVRTSFSDVLGRLKEVSNFTEATLIFEQSVSGELSENLKVMSRQAKKVGVDLDARVLSDQFLLEIKKQRRPSKGQALIIAQSLVSQNLVGGERTGFKSSYRWPPAKRFLPILSSVRVTWDWELWQLRFETRPKRLTLAELH